MSRKTLCLVAALLAYPMLVQATVINVDIDGGSTVGTYVGAAGVPGGTSTDVWNGYSVVGTLADPPQSGVLLDSTGTTTGTVRFDLLDAAVGDGWDAGGGQLMNDYILVSGAGVPIYNTFTITGLAASNSYDLYLYTGVASIAGRNATFKVDDVDKTTSGVTFGGTFVEGVTHVVYRGVTPDVNGTITGYVLGSGNYGTFNGLQIVGIVPEPSTVVLLGIGVLGLLAYAWRKRK